MNLPMVLPEDIRIVPLTELPPKVREQLEGEDGDYAITRPHSRTPSKVIDSNGAALLKQFEEPTTIVDAILRYSRSVNADPQQVLEEAYSLIETCLIAKLLVQPGEAAEKIQASFAAGDPVGGNTIEEAVQVLEDSEVYRVRTSNGKIAAMKIARPRAGQHLSRLLAHEALILDELHGGEVSPRFIGRGACDDQRPFLLMEWIEGVSADRAFGEMRQHADAQQKIFELCAAILDTYAALHAQLVIHSDVHPRNVLISPDKKVRLVDFGVARLAGDGARSAPRAGIGFFFEPEYAIAVRDRVSPPASSFAGEQYAVAVLLYSLIGGSHYLDFSFEKEEMMRQIAEDEPVPFERKHIEVPEPVEAVIFRALEKDPAKRFPTTAAFASAFREAIKTKAPSRGLSAMPSPRISDDLDRFVDDTLETISDPEKPLTYRGPASPTGSVTYGMAGIAYALHRIARARDDGRLLALADRWAEKAAVRSDCETLSPDAFYDLFYNNDIQITPETVGRISPYHTRSGIAAVQAFVAHARFDMDGLQRATTKFLDLTSENCENLDLTLGRTGVLLTLSLMLEAGAPEKPETLVGFGNRISESIWSELASVGRMREGAPISYLGMAHGWAGLLYGAMRWSRAAGVALPTGIEPRLDELAGLADVSGDGARWPVQATSRGMYMAGWCNGSAGYVHLWTLAHKLFGSPQYLELAERAGADAYATGGAGHSLCCGWAGQAYSQLSLYKHTGQAKWREQGEELAHRAAGFGTATLRRNEEALPFSLYKGNVGVAVLAAELRHPRAASMPFFEAEGWPTE